MKKDFKVIKSKNEKDDTLIKLLENKNFITRKPYIQSELDRNTKQTWTNESNELLVEVSTCSNVQNMYNIVCIDKVNTSTNIMLRDITKLISRSELIEFLTKFDVKNKSDIIETVNSFEVYISNINVSTLINVRHKMTYLEYSDYVKVYNKIFKYLPKHQLNLLNIRKIEESKYQASIQLQYMSTDRPNTQYVPHNITELEPRNIHKYILPIEKIIKIYNIQENNLEIITKQFTEIYDENNLLFDIDVKIETENYILE